jgi:pimeloyl-ACP methyl ester carboxylesterase
MDRRQLLRGAAALTAAAGAPRAFAQPRSGGLTFVLVHGAWHGGWCWARVAERLRADGHRVFTPTLTGLGERAHLISKAITLETFTQDVAAVIEAEELKDVVLVGHSFAGSPTSGAAERMPGRLRRLVYLDALIVEPGRSPFDSIPADLAAERRRLSQSTSGGLSLPNPEPSAFGVPDGPDADWVRRRLTPHPISTYESPLAIRGPIGAGLPRTYVHCTAPSYAALEASRRWVRATQGWEWREIATGHDAMVTAPGALSELLVRIARA